MAKKRKQYLDKLAKIQQIEREVEKEKKKIVVECSHQNEKGKLKIEPIGDHGEFMCKICKVEFNMEKLPTETIEDASKILHDAIQQIRCYSDADRDSRLIRLLGELDYNLAETAELYQRVVNVYTRDKGKKNKNNKRNEGFGSFGTGGGLSFIGK